MRTEIYYFSGTGNSLSVARDISNKIDGELISAVSVSDKDTIAPDADAIGFVFPIYDFKHPKVIDNLLGKINGIDSKYIFAVCTYGIAPSTSLINFGKAIESYGGKLSLGFAIAMPHNGIGSSSFSKGDHEKMYGAWQKKLGAVSEDIINKRGGKIEKSNLFFNFLSPRLMISVLPSLFIFFKEVITKGMASLKLNYNEKCDGCAICEKVCPMANINILEDRPIWGDNCAICFACYHWCPKGAVQAGSIKLKGEGYHHPDVKIKDMITQRKKIN